ncbi:hypothetical protein FA13DRAFT_1720818 [Coprinellus micaceus]|uniref:Uncharacterized protein n=1 Tax=Coprinellus micaceus TaxID=71717 RepID=A0A4Y7S7K9_COPMI|nr:hypothetical protein FA13DRAFT_1720818 [Coprinellus micaceus]
MSTVHQYHARSFFGVPDSFLRIEGKCILVNNEAVFNASIHIVTSVNLVYVLPDPVNTGVKGVRNDISKVEGFTTGTVFRVRVKTPITAKATTDDELTFDVNSNFQPSGPFPGVWEQTRSQVGKRKLGSGMGNHAWQLYGQVEHEAAGARSDYFLFQPPRKLSISRLLSC